MPIKLYSVKFVTILILFISFHFTVGAVVIDGLFDAKVAVKDQSNRSQNNAFIKGIKQVLIKVNGSQALLKDSEIRKGISRVTRYVRSYSYAMEDNQQYITINFDQERIENLIRTSGFPIWGKTRPDTLIWLSMQSSNNSKRNLLTNDNYPSFYGAMTNQSDVRGIQLVYPLWDLDDVQNLTVYDIWGGFAQRVAQASQRYGVQSVLSARVYPYQQDVNNEASTEHPINYKPGQWLADWTSIEDGQFLSGQLVANTLLEIGPKLIDALADQLSSKYAIDIDKLDLDQGKTEIVINNIKSIESYVNILTFLESLSVVNSATLIRQQGSQGTFELSLFGENEDLYNAFKLGSKIKPITDEFGQSLNNLEFLWHK
jgi:hypothetical protein